MIPWLKHTLENALFGKRDAGRFRVKMAGYGMKKQQIELPL